MMESITVQLKETHGVLRRNEPLRFGVPITQGQVQPRQLLSLTDDLDRSYPIQTTPTALWADGSIRWILAESLVNLKPGEQRTLQLGIQPSTLFDSPLHFRFTEQGPQVDTGALRMQINSNRLAWHPCFPADTATQGQTTIHLTNAQGQACADQVDHWEIVSEPAPVSLAVKATGRWLQKDGSVLANFECWLRFYRNSETVALEMCLHNPKRAHHPDGLWDLGDPGSIHFQSLFLQLHTGPQSQRSLSLGAQISNSSLPLGREITLYQDSSGGDQWHSRNHINADGQLTTRFRGYQLRDGARVLSSGDRAEPLVAIIAGGNRYQLGMPEFWQNFPSALSVYSDGIRAGLFPVEAAYPFELQGGERKNQRVYLNYGGSDSALDWIRAPLVPVLNAQSIELAEVLPWFKADRKAGALDALISESLDGPDNFLHKRELIDEYGWRNFGDIFADHETLYQPEDEAPLISHYNNQYDAIYGFARQFLLTGDKRWFTLLDDLARHVTDIDIYHTDEDRVEYNHGMFWHTDHYLDAHIATHRTFSRHNDISSTPGQTGGGPGSEHCYTTGLKYHYYLTGNLASKATVKGLADWMIASHEGSGGFLAQLLSIKKTELGLLRQLLKGEKPIPYRYPLTRGTGNYVNALLDTYDLYQDIAYLHRAETVIRNTIHPEDDIDARGLKNIEVAWSYVVFLTSLAHYLWLKERLDEQDSAYDYGRASLLAYCQWMRRHEEPYLTNPDILEYPNDTWAAQDIRKAMLMFIAANLDPTEAEAYCHKGQEWLDYVCMHLSNSTSKHFARIQIILLQNYGPHTIRPKMTATVESQNIKPARFGRPPRLTAPILAAKIVAKLFKGILQFRLQKERAWLQVRVNRL